jgi:hypothetical protein
MRRDILKDLAVKADSCGGMSEGHGPHPSFCSWLNANDQLP